MKKPGVFFVITSDSPEMSKVAKDYLRAMFKENFVHMDKTLDSDYVYRIRKLKEEPVCADWKTSLLLLEAIFSEQLERVVLPAIASGKHVIMSGFDAEAFNDFVPSHDMDSLAFFHRINNAVTGLCRPSVYIHLRVAKESSGYDLFLEEVVKNGGNVIPLDSINTSQGDFLSLLEYAVENY